MLKSELLVFQLINYIRMNEYTYIFENITKNVYISFNTLTSMWATGGAQIILF